MSSHTLVAALRGLLPLAAALSTRFCSDSAAQPPPVPADRAAANRNVNGPRDAQIPQHGSCWVG